MESRFKKQNRDTQIITTDSTVASQWLKDQKKLQSLRRKESKNVSSHEFIEWQYALPKQNPSDTAARGTLVCKLTNLW